MIYHTVIIWFHISTGIFTRRRRSAFEEDLSMLSVVESLDSVEKTINKLSNEIKPGSPISSENICKMKWRVCQVAQTNRYLYMSRNSKRYYGNVKILEKFYIETRWVNTKLRITNILDIGPQKIVSKQINFLLQENEG